MVRRNMLIGFSSSLRPGNIDTNEPLDAGAAGGVAGMLGVDTLVVTDVCG